MRRASSWRRAVLLRAALAFALLLSAMIGFRQRWNVEVERRREPAPA